MPSCFQQSGWVLHQTGKCYYENDKMSECIQSFENMREIEPYRHEGLEIYSAALWKLQKTKDLSFLSRQVVDFDRKSPETWCVVGNCFSLQKDHEAAIKFFQRAFQLDPHFTYAYTLIGHEYVSNDQFEKAVDCFRKAIRIDARHYPAWSGLAFVYFREEKFDLAEYHFKYAEKINKGNVSLLTYIGMVQQSRRDYSAALLTFEKIILQSMKSRDELEERRKPNPRAKFHHAAVLLCMERYEEAYEELKEVCDYFPTEAQVCIHIIGIHIIFCIICKI